METSGYSDKKRLNKKPNRFSDDELRALLTEEELTALDQFKAEHSDLCEGRTDRFLVRFLFARKLDVGRAAELLQNHLNWREKHHADEFNYEDYAKFFQYTANAWLPGAYDRHGRSIAYILMGKLNLKGYMEELEGKDSSFVIRTHYFMADLLSDHDLDIMRKGMIIVEDFKGLSFMDMMKLTRVPGQDPKEMMDSLQNNIPLRIGGFLIVNAPWYIKAAMAVFKPFMKPKLRDKFVVLSKQEDLNEYITKENLVTELGGEVEHDLEKQQKFFKKYRNKFSDGEYFDARVRSPELIATYEGDHSTRADKSISSKKLKAKGKAVE